MHLFLFISCKSTDPLPTSVRVSGRPLIKEFICEPLDRGDQLRESERERSKRVSHLSGISHEYQPWSLWGVEKIESPEDDRVTNISNQAPNLTLNVETHRLFSWSLAGTGIFVQAGVIWSTGIVTLYFNEYKSTRLFSPELGYYIFISGQFALYCIYVGYF